jgi:hypothetical protein
MTADAIEKRNQEGCFGRGFPGHWPKAYLFRILIDNADIVVAHLSS